MNTSSIFTSRLFTSLALAAFAACGAADSPATARPDVVMRPDGEVRTLQTALEKVRALRATGAIPATRAAEIRVEPGRYSVTAPAVFTPADSCIHVSAAEPGRAVFDGGVALAPFTVGADGVWRAKAPVAFPFEQLYVNGRRAQRARTPNKFYLYMRAPWEGSVDPRDGKPRDLCRSAFIADPKDVAALAALPPDELKDVEIQYWQSWDHARAKVDYVDGRTGAVISKTGASRPLFYWSSTCPRYALENYRGALDAPGEWFFDRKAGEVLYIPRPGETPSATRAVVPRAKGFATFAGDPLKDAFVKDVFFSGLVFQYGAWTMPPEGAPNAQSAQNIREAAVFGDGVVGFSMDHCTIRHMGAHGVWLKRGCRNCSVTHCRIEDLGGGGVYLGDTANWKTEPPELRTGFNRVEDNVIRSGGFAFNGSIGVWLGHATDNLIAHNDIGDFFYTGVSMGWCWGYGETMNRRNRLLWNRIHHIGKGVLSDMGGVYTLGNAEGTVEMGNWIHDVNGYSGAGSPAWGLYTDEGSRGILHCSNLVERCRDGAVHQHYGQDNVWANNIFATFDVHGVWRSRIEDHTTVIVTNNVFWWTNPEAHLLSGNAHATVKDVVFDGNLYWGVNGVATNAFSGRSLDAWRAAGHDRASKFADPKFADPAKGDWRLADDSPARAMGFVPWDWTLAGVLKTDAAWRAAAMDDSSIPALEDAPKAPRYFRTQIHQDFENCRFGTQRTYGALSPDHPTGIKVVEGGCTGKHALRLEDGPAHPQAWQPHLISQVGCTNGDVRIRFAFKVEDETVSPQFECRDYNPPNGAPYATGPMVTMRKGVVCGCGRELGRVPVGAWCRIEILLHVTGRTWDCSVTPVTDASRVVPPVTDASRVATPVVTQGLPLNKNFVVLDWQGFMTNGRETCAWQIDDFSVEPVP